MRTSTLTSVIVLIFVVYFSAFLLGATFVFAQGPPGLPPPPPGGFPGGDDGGGDAGGD